MLARDISGTLFLLVALQGLTAANKLMRAPLVLDNEDPIVHIKVDGQEVGLLADTGALSLFLIWKAWYTETYQKPCDSSIFGCYECNPSPCQEGPTETIEFDEGSNVTVFDHSGLIKFAEGVAGGINFGLICGFGSPDPTMEVWASLGLGPPDGGPTYTSITQQLADKGLIAASSSSIYMKPDGARMVGEVIFGGEDKSKYDGPMRFIKVMSDDFVQFFTTSIEGHKILMGTQYARVDSGSYKLVIPKRFESQIVTLIRKRIQIDKKEDMFFFHCEDFKSLPTITYTFMGSQGEGVPLGISLGALFLPYEQGLCYLPLYFVDEDIWILGSIAFVNHYWSFDWGNSRIGVAKSKS